MKYTPSLPERNDNVTSEHPLKDFLRILSALVVLALLGFFVLGLLVDTVVEQMQPDTEAALMRIMAQQAAVTAPSAGAAEQQLQQLVDSLRPCAGLAGPIRVQLHASDTANAIVLPGGTIEVFGGLLAQVQSENGLAFVLAHSPP